MFYCKHFSLVLALVSLSATAWAAAPAKGLNPDIGVNFLGLFQRGTAISDERTEHSHNGLSIQEAELQFSADVDPYSKAKVLLGIHQEDGTTEYAVEPEELYFETISIPWVTLRGGKMNLAFGKHNVSHTHAFPFIDAPLINQQLFGEHGLNETAVSTAILIPVGWFSEVTMQVFNPSNEDMYGSPKSGDTGGLVHLKNLWDLNDDLTMEVGLSGTMGKNQMDRMSSVLGADLTFKWRPSEGGKYHAFVWSTEFLSGNRKGMTDPVTGAPIDRLDGMATWVQYQFAQRWWIQARNEHVGYSQSEALPSQDKNSALLGFFPSEFSGLRLQYDHIKTEGLKYADHTVALQYNISIGAHPAHAY